MAQLLPDVVFRLLDSSANPISGGTATFYLSGTSTPTPVYSNATLATALPNPISTNSAGLFVNGSNAVTAIYTDDSIEYRAVFKDATGTTIRDIDPVFPIGTRNLPTGGTVGQYLRKNSSTDFDTDFATILSSEVDWIQAGTGAVTRTAQAKLRDSLNALDFIPVAQHAAILARTSTYDCSADVAAALVVCSAQKKTLRFGGGRYRFLSDITVPVGNGLAVDIVGEGQEQTQIEFFGSGSTRGIVLDGATGYVYAGKISDLTVYPNTGSARGVTLENLNRPKLENVNILNAPACGIYIDTVIMPRLSHVLLVGCGSASFGAIEIDNSTTALLDEVYVSGSLAVGGTGKIGGILIDRSVNFTMIGGAIESTGTPIKIASKSEGTIPCDGGVIVGTDLENPGDNLPYIDVGNGWSGAASLAAKSWTFINVHGFPSGTTTSLYGVKLEDVVGFTFTNCSLGQAGTPTSLYELVGTANRGVIINPARALYGTAWPYVRVNGTQVYSATPLTAWNSESPTPIDASKTITGSTPSASPLAAQGGSYAKFYLNNAGPTNLTNLTDGYVSQIITLMDAVGNTTIKHEAGGAGQFTNPTGADIVMVLNQPYLYYNNPSTGRWHGY
jgi:hypothetical protein